MPRPLHSAPHAPATRYTRPSSDHDAAAPPSEAFDLPVDKIRQGYYSDAYFNHTKRVLEVDGQHPHVLAQVFQKKRAVLGGMDEAIAILRECAGHYAADGAWIPGWDA